MATLKTNVPLQADTNYGAANSETGVPGFKDVTGNKFKITSNKIMSADNSSAYLRNAYLDGIDPTSGLKTYLNVGEGDQWIEWRSKPGDRYKGKHFSLRVNPASPGAYYVRFQGPLAPAAAFAQLSTTNNTGAINQNTPNFSMNDTDEYKFRFKVTGTLANTNVAISVTIYNITTSSPHIWSSGTDTFTWNPTSGVPDTGVIDISGNNSSDGGLAHIGLPVDVYTEGILATLATQPARITAQLIAGSETGGSITVYHDGFTGGQGTKTLTQWTSPTSPYFSPPGSGTLLNTVVGSATTSHTLTGFAPGAFTGYFKSRTTDTNSGASDSSPVATILPMIATHAYINGNLWPVSYILVAGDSLAGSVSGGLPSAKATSEVLSELVSSYNGSSDTLPYLYDNISFPGLGGSALIDNVNYIPLLAQIDLRQATNILVRIGHNDTDENASVANILAFANQLQNDRPGIRIFFAPITPKAAPFTQNHALDKTNMEFCRRHTIQLNTLHDPNLKRYVLPPFAQSWLARNVEAYGVNDASHWDASIYQKIGKLEAYAMWPYWCHAFGSTGPNAWSWNGLSSGGNSGAVSINGGLI